MVKRRHRRELYATIETALDRYSSTLLFMCLLPILPFFQSKPTWKAVRAQVDLRGERSAKSAGCFVHRGHHSVDLKVRVI